MSRRKRLRVLLRLCPRPSRRDFGVRAVYVEVMGVKGSSEGSCEVCRFARMEGSQPFAPF